MGWFQRLIGRPVVAPSTSKDSTGQNVHGDRESPVGIYEDRPLFDYVEKVKQLKREGKLDEAASLLEKLVDETRMASRKSGMVAAPWYWEQLAIVYRKMGRIDDEVHLLREYVERHENPGATGDVLRARLPKAEELQAKRLNS
jgi:hypothetical protein